MTEWKVEAARYAHVNRIANRMCEVDRVEVAAYGRSPKNALVASLRASVLAWTIFRDGDAICMLGVAPISMIGRRGRIWMMGTDALEKSARGFLTLAPGLVAAMREDFPYLENCISVENRIALVLRRLGFAFDEEPCYIGGVAFRRFSIGPD